MARSLPASNLSLSQIATEFLQSNTNSKIRLYGGGESGISASATGVQRSFSEFANKEYKIIKYLSNSINEINLTTLFSAELTKVNSKKAIANANVFITTISATTSWVGNIDLVNYGVIMGRSPSRNVGGNVINISSSVTSGKFQVVNLGEMIPAGGGGGDGGAGANGYIYTTGGLVSAMGVGGTGGGATKSSGLNDLGAYGFGMSTLSGVGVIQLATYRYGFASNLAYWAGDGGTSGYGGGAGQAGTDGNLGNIGHTRNPNGSVVETTPPSTGARAPTTGYAGGSLIYGNNRVNFTDNGYSIGDISGVVTTAGGIGEILSVTPPSTYIIPKDSIILYDGANPQYSEWAYFADATDKFIKGTATQGEIGTSVAESGSTSIDISGLTAGMAGAHVSNTKNLQGRGSLYSSYKYADIDGDHTHALNASAVTGNPLPAKSKFTLLRAVSDQRRFPPNTKFINENSRSLTSTVDIASAGYKYIVGTNAAHSIVAQTGVSTTITTGYGGGSHTHNTTNASYPSEQVYTASQSGAFRDPVPDLRSHNHSSTTLTIYLNSLSGKLLSIWNDATSTILCTNDMLMYCGDLSLLPSYWKICDGTNGTVDMRNYFFGHATTGQTHGQESVIDYTFPASLGSLTTSTWTHSHYTNPTTITYDAGPTLGSHPTYNASHTHTISGTPSAVSNYLPAHIKLAFIKFVP